VVVGDPLSYGSTSFENVWEFSLENGV